MPSPARSPALTARGPATERSRCPTERPSAFAARPTYKVDGTGLGLKQTLRCASDSYKFDLSSDVTSQGDRISGNWSEASRNVFGNLQGTAGGGQIEVFVEAAGFAANLTLHHRQQADGADQFQGRDPRREHHHGQELTASTFFR